MVSLFEKQVTITAAMVEQFAEITGDSNPIHLDPEYAKGTRFGKCIVHGALLNGLISGALTEMLGTGTVYLSQDMHYRVPVFVGSTVTLRLTVVELLDKNGAIIRTEVIAHDNVLAAVGEARVKLPLKKV
jgi:acyl dehydratase